MDYDVKLDHSWRVFSHTEPLLLFWIVKIVKLWSGFAHKFKTQWGFNFKKGLCFFYWLENLLYSQMSVRPSDLFFSLLSFMNPQQSGLNICFHFLIFTELDF